MTATWPVAWTATWAVARATLREVSRRRGVLLLLLAMPLSFYVIRSDLQGQSIRMLALGLGWAIATLALFTSSAARSVDVRLRVAGLSAGALVTGRMLAMTGSGFALATGYAVLIGLDQDVRRYWAVCLLLATTVLVAAPLGAVVATVVPRDLEGALLLLTVLATQMLADPAGSVAKVLPFWSTRELATYAIDGTGPEYLYGGLAHFAGTCGLLMAVAITISTLRLRLARPSHPRPDDAVAR
ncbi:MAG: hypothetical protein ACRCYX_07190 [Dermatophilaceae bacterium]